MPRHIALDGSDRRQLADPGELSATFDQHFSVELADTSESLSEALALRYQVYCLERGFEDPARNPDGHERDEFDQRSVHAIVRHRSSGGCIAAVRLVLSSPSAPSSLFPVEAACGDQFYAGVWERVRAIPRARLGEISRFAVSKQFRRRHTEANYIEGISPHVPYFDAGHPIMNHRRVMPYVTLGLFAAVIRLSLRHGVTHWFAVMEPTLLRLLRTFGIHFPAIGPVVEYHGRRQPTLAVGTEVANRARHERPDVWALVTEKGRCLPPSA